MYENNIKRICIADFKKKITIEKYSSLGNSSPDSNAFISYQTIATVFAMVKTFAVGDFVNNVNIANSITIDFYIKYNSAIDISQQLFILLDNKRYKVELIDDIDKDSSIVRLRARELGLSTLQANSI